MKRANLIISNIGEFQWFMERTSSSDKKELVITLNKMLKEAQEEKIWGGVASVLEISCISACISVLFSANYLYFGIKAKKIKECIEQVDLLLKEGCSDKKD